MLRPEHPACGSGVGVLLLAGSSGRVDVPRARLLQRHGATVLAVRWFGGPGQQPGPHEVPLELFLGALDVLRPEADDLAVVGTSFGGEAALLVAAEDPGVRAVVGFAASSVVWPGWTGGAWTSHWTLRSRPLPFVPLDPGWTPDTDPPRFRGLYERSLAARADDSGDIPVERIAGDVLLVAGGDDGVWPAEAFADRVAARRAAHGLRTEVVRHRDAGHRAVLPGEEPAQGGQRMDRGGSPEADAALGRAAWPAVVRHLGLEELGGRAVLP
ncbi:acyl-CoA thioesterase [Amnibacterium setariae]|uniref:Acyl-CoA thioesterase n=1 Tax=Amnibacterium setariae TaxID=2306585 RepID=A0A3A1TYI1_9MICO|nr:acyl-CoA thioesterase [Amnibacterium setariae]